MAKEFYMSNPSIKLADLEAMGLKIFDPAEYITSDEVAAVYINEALDVDDAELLASAIGDVARACGMTEIAKNASAARESLCEALRQSSQPRLETISRVLVALGLRFVVEPAVEQTTAPAKKKKSKSKATSI
jgi:probable addiction module antidote protein